MTEQRLRPTASRSSRGASALPLRYVGPALGLALAVAFVVVFFAGRSHQPLNDIAPRVGMNYDELMAMGPRIATSTGASLGTSRRVIYLLACSGQADRASFEGRAADAGRAAREQRLSDREAVQAVLVRTIPLPAVNDSLKDC